VAYEQRNLRRQKVRYNSANADSPLTFQLVDEGDGKVTPDEAPTITIYREGVSDALLEDQDTTLSGTLATYSIDTTTTATWPVSGNYRAELTVVVSSVSHVRHLVFDVVKYLLDIGIGRDQLLDRDEKILARAHAGNETLQPIINACRDDLQFMLETKAIENDAVLENMVIDPSRLAVPARYYILEALTREIDTDLADYYQKHFDSMWRNLLSGIKWDANLDGYEDSEQGDAGHQRLYT